MSKVTIEKVNIKIGKKVILLTLDEARELKQVLSDMFGTDKSYPVTIPMPYPVYPTRRYEWWEVKPMWTGGDTGITTTSDNTNGIIISSVTQ